MRGAGTACKCSDWPPTGGVALKHHEHVFELGHDRVAELFHDDEALNHRTTLLYGRRKERTYGRAYAAMDGSVGLGLGPDRTVATISGTSLGAVVQARLSLGTRHFGVQGRAPRRSVHGGPLLHAHAGLTRALSTG